MRRGALLVLMLAGAAVFPAAARDLTFDQRLSAQEAIERVYYTHQIGAARPFEEAVPRALLEEKVRTYLKQSAALELAWREPITAAMLQKEADRITVRSQMPERLSELLQALGGDAFLFQETVVRASLAAHLVRERLLDDPEPASHFASFAAGDDTEAWWREAAPRFDFERVPTAANPATEIATGARGGAAVSCGTPDDSWEASLLTNQPHDRNDHTAIWTGTEMLVWGGHMDTYYSVTNTGVRYDPVTDRWAPMSAVSAPAPRSYHTAVWTGSEMIVWGGGTDLYTLTNSGGRYNPVTDTWTATTVSGAPGPREHHSAVWTGSRMIVWAGDNPSDLTSGGQYDPATDSWTATSLTNAPFGRTGHSAVWTGSRMIVWGGTIGGNAERSGGRYDPATNTWQSMSIIGAPSARTGSSTVWTGARMVVWGGLDPSLSQYVNDGARYNPQTDTWSPVSNGGPPTARGFHTAVWTGSRMIVWSGYTNFGNYPSSGSRYDPVGDTWSPISSVNAPSGRIDHTAVWTGNRMIVWGGAVATNVGNSGGRYNPQSDTWAPTSAGIPEARWGHATVWTGNEMIVWGGIQTGGTFIGTALGSGARYNPALETWTPTATSNAPSARGLLGSIWSGTEMIVWGGEDGVGNTFGTGGRYNPATNAWQTISGVGAPPARSQPGAVWTGSEMMIWGGGKFGGGPVANTGGRYNASTDTWGTTNVASAPPGYRRPTLALAGGDVLVWLGTAGSRYTLATDTWTPFSTVNGPYTCDMSTAVWTGARLVVWGGECGSDMPSYGGGQYDPATDTWVLRTVSHPILGGSTATGVWTGREVVFFAGYSNLVGMVQTFERYDPVADQWSLLTNPGVMKARWYGSAVWTGSRMLVWGGNTDFASRPTDTGGTWFPGASATDDDGDGFTECTGLVHDCNDTNGGVFAVPGEIGGVAVASPGSISWLSAVPTSGSATVHDVLRGIASQLPVGAGGSEVCLVSGSGGSGTSDASLPAPGQAFFYLVRGRNACAMGTYGFASAGAERVSAACP